MGSFHNTVTESLKDPQNTTRFCVSLYILMLGLPVHPGLSQIVLAAAVVSTVLFPPGANSTLPRYVWAVLGAFLLTTAASLLQSVNLERSMDVSISLISGLFLVYCCANLISPQSISQVLLAFCIAGLMISLSYLGIAAFNWGSAVETWMTISPYPQFGVPNDLGILSISGIAAIALFNPDRTKMLQCLLALVLVTVLCCLLIYQSRGGILALILAAIVLSVRRNHRLWILLFTGLVGLGLLVDAAAGFSFIQKAAQVQTVGTRAPLWIAAFNMFIDAPLLGHGPGSFALLYRDYVDLSRLPEWILVDDRDMPWAHNLYLELLAERGILGLLAFASIVIIIFTLLAQSYRQTETNLSRLNHSCLKFALIGLLLLGVFESSLLRHWVVVTYSLILGCVLACWRQSNYRILK